MIREREAEWIEGFSWVDAGRERLAALSAHAWPVSEVTEEERIPENIVQGCQTPVWLTARREGNLVRFHCSSDSPLVGGLARAMASLYDGAAPEEIRVTEPTWIAALKVDDILSPTRLRGLSGVRTRIVELAI